MSETVTTSQQELVGKYKPYPEYKDSGISRLGNIPSHWQPKKLKRMASIENGRDYKHVEAPEGFPVIGSGGQFTWSSEYIYNGESVLLGRKGTVDRPLYINGPFWTVDTMFYTKVCNIIPAKFLYYAALTIEFGLYSTNTALPSMTQEDLGNVHFGSPSYEEAENIAAFLDYETARIDRLIAQQQRLIELLKEKRQALISHAVRTRPGEGHIKLAYAINLLTGYPFASSGFKSAKDTHIPLLRGANVGVDQIKWDDVVYWDSEDCSHLDDYYLECGDIVFGMDRPWISSGARVAEITQHDTPCLLLQRVARIRAKANHFQTYIKLCLSSNEFRNYVEADLTGVSVPHISPDQIKGFLIRNLPYDEQVSVTKEVLQALEKLNAVERAAFNAIELLQERRTALISAAVTGKIDLRYWTRPAEEAAA